MTTHDISKTERVEMYLKAVYTVQQAAPPVTASKVAEFMGVATPSAWEMLRRLEHQGLVRGAGEDGFHLTPAGLERATKVVRRLRLAERLLTDVLRLDLPRVYDEACKMEHVISEEVEARLADVLGHPCTCPHGLPIPGESSEPPPSHTLLDAGPGTRGRVAAIPEEDSAMVAYLAGLGLVPGAAVDVEEIAPFNGPLTISVGGRRQAIGREVAARIRVDLRERGNATPST
ncbi:MAG: metal-dependent transcriptional regulator [Armatimonadota bacterium]|nr:metal-dependent transcriptional regulator [Armatimonadota bacterium]MDR7402527.1 metal-dependent transcriptional regulator [Armatimonadota bacterium]MDR7403695.1 metal-dependent transcriptional regulator [Armatimonadota bacterium]MDR7436084.1 metal-dependent transcriptional regulator [Armatimonadota bacterium]MDR7471963.1 metal-dependent transcriptional regulator [Armatimonadota bacterium]